MLDYSQSKVYVVKNTINDYVYVGSTTIDIEERFKQHQRKNKCSLYKYVLNNFNGDWSDFKIELVTDYSCNNSKELHFKEFEVLLQYPYHININNPKPINNIKEKMKEYYQQNRVYRINYQINYNKEYYKNKKLNKNIIYIIILIYINHLFYFH